MALRQIPLWYAGREQRSLDTRELESYRGDAFASVMIASPLSVGRAAAQLRAAAETPIDPQHLWSAVARAGELIGAATLDDLTPHQFAEQLTLSTGLPIHWSRAGVAELAGALCQIEDALRWQAPAGDLAAFRTHECNFDGGRSFAWVPTGRVLGVLEASNHPAVQQGWVQALAMGWSVLLRPGSDDPFTPRRIALALEQAGFPMDRLAILNGQHDLVAPMLAACDRILAYGGSALESALGGERKVLFNGPGRCKVYVADPAAASEGLDDYLFDSVAHAGGRKCVCTSAVVVRGQDQGALERLAGRLNEMPLLDPMHPESRVPASKRAASVAPPARTIVKDGVSYLKPDLVRCRDEKAAGFGMELSTPWAVGLVLEEGRDPLSVLRDSLVVAILTPDEILRRRCLAEPTIGKVFSGHIPTWRMTPGAPHKGRLSDLLFVSKSAWVDR